MKTFLCVTFLSVAAAAFAPQSASVRTGASALQVGYVPDGMTPEQYRRLREREAAAAKTKKFGAFGPQSFVSRSLVAFQTDLEKGKAGHLMPVMNAKKLVASGKIKPQDIPYMQRQGSWDDSDIAGARKKEWTDKDMKYNQFEKPWWGGALLMGGPKAAAKKATPPPTPSPQPKKLFGVF